MRKATKLALFALFALIAILSVVIWTHIFMLTHNVEFNVSPMMILNVVRYTPNVVRFVNEVK